MSWKINYSEDSGIVTIKTEGHYDAANGNQLISELYKSCKEKNTFRCLIDHSDAEVKFSTMDKFERPASYEAIPEGRRLKVAIVFKKNTETARFYENVCINRGYNIKMFSSVDDATSWLLIM